jgi:hypothetical protein
MGRNLRALALVGAAATASVLWAAAGTPSAVYFAYRDAALKAKIADDIAPYLKKADLAQMKAAPPKLKELFLNLHQSMEKMATVAPKVLKETVQGDTATLELETVCDYTSYDPHLGKKKCKATLKLLKEGGAWKIGDVPSWQQSEP